LSVRISKDKKMKISVVGGGIGGLTAALSLLRQGFDVDVYEQAVELKEVGAGVQVSANGTRVLFSLGLEEDIMSIASQAQGKEIRLWNTGQTWKLFDLGPLSIERYGFPYITIHRNDLHQTLAAGVRRIRPDAIKLSKKCVGITQDDKGATITFADGTTATLGYRRRRRWGAFEDPRDAVRPRRPEIHRHRRLARRHPGRAPAGTHAAAGRHQLDRPRRPRHPVPAAGRQADELRLGRRARRLAGRVLVGRGHRRKSALPTTKAGTRTSTR
jgi:hypothetical protein